MSISDINTNVVYKEDFICYNSYTKHLNLKDLIPGTYFINIKSKTTSTTRKIIIE